MRRSVAVAVAVGVLTNLAACGFQIDAGGGDDVPDGSPITIVDDTAADFAAHVELDDGVIAARGAIEPEAFVLGGLYARGYAGNLVADASTYDSVVAAVGPALGEGYRQVPTSWAPTVEKRPRGLGIAVASNYTILYTGEILLPAGTIELVAEADDRVVVQVALDGATFGDRLFAHNSKQAITIEVPVAGWFPIRAAYGQAGGNAYFTLTATPMFEPAIPIDATRLRARVTDVPGLRVTAFEGYRLVVDQGEAAVPTIEAQFGTAIPGLDLPILADNFSLRYAGQLRIDELGAYTFTGDAGPDPTDVWRLWIDGVQVASHWDPTPDIATVTLDLAPGWHDLLFDYGDAVGDAQLALRMAGPNVVDGPIDPARLRPAVRFGLTASYFTAVRTPLVDATAVGPGVVEARTPVAAPSGATIAAIDHGFGIENQRMSDLIVDRLDCHGTSRQLIGTVPQYHYYAGDTGCAGKSPNGPPAWGFRVRDTVIGNDPAYSLLVPALWGQLMVATYTGGDQLPFAPTVTFVSTPRPTPGAIGLGPVHVTADLRGGAIVIELRTAADEAGLAAAAWQEVSDGDVPMLAAGAFLQYRLTLITSGWQLATVDKVEITYLVPNE